MVWTADIKGSEWTVAIGGFGNVSVGDVDAFLECLTEATAPAVYQVFDADRIAGREHLFFAAVNAVKAVQSGSAISRSLAIETLLYASCDNQISKALDATGISGSTSRVALVVLARGRKAAEGAFDRASLELGGADDSVLGLDADKIERVKDIFGVTDAEIEAVGGSDEEALCRLLVERGALLALRR